MKSFLLSSPALSWKEGEGWNSALGHTCAQEMVTSHSILTITEDQKGIGVDELEQLLGTRKLNSMDFSN